MLQTVGKWVAETLGRDSVPIRMSRPIYQRALDVVSFGKGARQTVNGLDQFWVNPRHRAYYPATYEPPVYRFLRDSVHSGAVCLNVGAHVGTYAAALATWCGTDGRVVAFEPNPETAELLADYLRRNSLNDRITIVRSAVGSECGEASFVASGIEGYSRVGQPHPEQATTPNRLITVQMATIDSYCSTHEISPDWIVMDIEGFEIAALRGAEETIKRRRDKLQFAVEMHPTLWPLAGESETTFQTVLSDLNLEAIPLTGQDDPFAVNGVTHIRWAC